MKLDYGQKSAAATTHHVVSQLQVGRLRADLANQEAADENHRWQHHADDLNA